MRKKNRRLIWRVSILFTLLCFFTIRPVLAGDSGLLWLINPDNPLEASYRPEQLTNIGGYPIRPEVGSAFLKMLNDMKADGVKGLRLQSAYRPYLYQQALFEEKAAFWRSAGHEEKVARTLAARSVAMPGASEHQTGLAIDVSVNNQLSVHFGDTEAGIWLLNNCTRYGFILRYPKEKTAITRIIYEPWHLRYVGIPHAAYMQEHNLCLEEYIDHLKNFRTLLYWQDHQSYYKITYTQGLPPTQKHQNISSLSPKNSAYIITELKEFLR